jgi:hypothetical protein
VRDGWTSQQSGLPATPRWLAVESIFSGTANALHVTGMIHSIQTLSLVLCGVPRRGWVVPS